MQFGLTFKTSDEKLTLFDAFNQGDGMDIVDFVREEVGHDIDITLIERTCDIDMARSKKEIRLNAEKRKGIIETYPVFKHFDNADVIVPVGWFGQFVKQSVKVEYYEPSFECEIKWLGYLFVIPYFIVLYFRLAHKAKWDNHKNGTKPFKIKKIIVMNTYHISDVVDAWIEDGMNHYWGITEKRHHEMVLAEEACAVARKEERVRKEREAKAENLRNLRVKTESEIWDFDAIAEDLDTMAKRIRLAQEKHNKAAALKAGVYEPEKK